MNRLLGCIPCTKATTRSVSTVRWPNGTDRGRSAKVGNAKAESVTGSGVSTAGAGDNHSAAQGAQQAPGAACSPQLDAALEQSKNEKGIQPPVQVADVEKDKVHFNLLVHRRSKDGIWVQYSASTAQVIIQAAAAAEKGLFVYVDEDSTKPLERVWIDFHTMREVGFDGIRTREIRFEAVPVTSPKPAPKTKRQWLIEAFDFLRSKEFLQDALKSRMPTMNLLKTRCNPYLDSGSGLYSNFLTAAEKIGVFGNLTDEDPSCSFGQLLADADKKCPAVELVFHGTAVGNIEPILRKGMNPSLRKYGGDYFGRKAGLSRAYCKPDKSPYRMVVFLILRVTDSHTFAFNGDAIVIYKVEFELPVAEITLA